MTTTFPTESVMLHLGLGSFHRAHQACYLQALIDKGDTGWHLVGGNIRPDMADTMRALIAQDGRYTLETVTPAGERSYTEITSLREVVPFAASLSGLLVHAAKAATRIISFTVTEAGYYLDAHNNLDRAAPDIARDVAVLRGQSAPGDAGITIYGAVALLLRARLQAQVGAVTLLNCDNLRHNGERFRKGLLQFLAQLQDPALLAWVEANTSCPNAMVDRITPRPTPDIAERVLAATGRVDAAPVMAESFIQWVIEDRFIAGRPAWEAVGVEMVASVDAYEEAKIRLLNATHSCIAWAGTLVGYSYIHEGTHDPVIRRMAYDYVTDDTIPVLDTPDKPSPLDLRKYRDVVLDRFGNPAICDTNQRVAMDGYTKIASFVMPTIRDCLAQGRSIDSVAMLPALFLSYLQRWHAGGIAYTYQDQVMNVQQAHAICSAADPVQAFVADRLLFGELASNTQLLNAVRNAHQRVHQLLKR